jgi:hypothetical protein
LQILFEKGSMTAGRLWSWYGHYEPLPFMGDTFYWRLLADLSNAAEPAVTVNGQRAGSEEVIPAARIDLLSFGERLLRNEEDWLAAKPAARWVGGVLIDPSENLNWRFDEERETLMRS